MTQTWLVPLDGSEISLHPVAWIVNNIAAFKETPRIHLLNVQPALPGDIGLFVNADAIRDYHRDAGAAALKDGLALLAASGIIAEQHILVGEAAPTITQFAAKHDCTQILIGTRGHSGLTGTLLGSVAMRVAHLATVPVTLIR